MARIPKARRYSSIRIQFVYWAKICSISGGPYNTKRADSGQGGKTILAGWFWPDGLEITSRERRSRLEPMSNKIRDEIHRYKVISDIRAYDWGTVSLEKLQRILDIMEED